MELIIMEFIIIIVQIQKLLWIMGKFVENILECVMKLVVQVQYLV